MADDVIDVLEIERVKEHGRGPEWHVWNVNISDGTIPGAITVCITDHGDIRLDDAEAFIRDELLPRPSRRAGRERWR